MSHKADINKDMSMLAFIVKESGIDPDDDRVDDATILICDGVEDDTVLIDALVRPAVVVKSFLMCHTGGTINVKIK